MKKEDNTLKKEFIEISYAVEKIDNILASDENLESYLSTIENNKFAVPHDLENRLKQKILHLVPEKKGNVISLDTEPIIQSHHQDRKQEPKRKQMRMFDIVKIAACAVFAVLIWEVAMLSPSRNEEDNTKAKSQKNHEILANINQATRSVSEFLMKPINLERREK